MQSKHPDIEILYVQKLLYFLYLTTFALLTCALTFVLFGLNIGLLVFAGGLCISYVTMLKKNSFILPEKRITIKRMARTIAQDTSPQSIARFASQLYYYLHQPKQAISLLEKFLPSQDPLLCTTLGDILLKEGHTQLALKILDDNPYTCADPLLLATQGHALKQINNIHESAKKFEQSLQLAKQNGFADSGSNWLTKKLLTLSYTAFIHHTLADCYVMLEDIPKAKRHYRAGNRLIFDFSLWRFYQSSPDYSAKNYMKSL